MFCSKLLYSCLGFSSQIDLGTLRSLTTEPDMMGICISIIPSNRSHTETWCQRSIAFLLAKLFGPCKFPSARVPSAVVRKQLRHPCRFKCHRLIDFLVTLKRPPQIYRDTDSSVMSSSTLCRSTTRIVPRSRTIPRVSCISPLATRSFYRASRSHPLTLGAAPQRPLLLKPISQTGVRSIFIQTESTPNADVSC